MRPNFDSMTTAELRTYCAYLYKVGCRAHSFMNDMNNYISAHESILPKELHKSKERAKIIIGQLEVLGLKI